MKYSVITFGCRVNQADSLSVEEGFARAARVAAAGRRGRHRRREHLFGHGKRRPGGAANDPAHRAHQSSRPDRRHRLLRDPSARRGRAICLAWCASSPTTTSHGSIRRVCSASPIRRLTARSFRRRRRRLRRGARARRCRPNGVHAAGADRMRRSVLVLHHSDDARPAEKRADRRCARRGRARRPRRASRRSR